MSTYLVAFVVCDFETISQISEKGVNVSVIAAKDKIDQAEFALKSASEIMDFYDEYFGVPYPLPKQGKRRGLIIALGSTYLLLFFF